MSLKKRPIQFSINNQFCRRKQPVLPDEAFGASVGMPKLGDDHATWIGLMREQ
jgi:hypothetical protein